MAKRFDIYLNERLTQGDIIIYSLPFRCSLEVKSGLILDNHIDSGTLKKPVLSDPDNAPTIEVHSRISNGCVAKPITAGGIIEFSSSSSKAALGQAIAPVPTEIVQTASQAAAAMKRRRALYEMDEDALLNYDDMTLDDIDYVIP